MEQDRFQSARSRRRTEARHRGNTRRPLSTDVVDPLATRTAFRRGVLTNLPARRFAAHFLVDAAANRGAMRVR
jgi:hypothetical protein